MGTTAADPFATRQAAYRSFSRISAAAAIALGALVLVGWIFRFEVLLSLRPGFVSMQPNTALGLLLGGIALLGSPGIRRGAAWALTLLGAATCAEYLFSVDLHIDEVLFRGTSAGLQVGPPGRMSPITAANYLILGIVLLLLDRPEARRIIDVLSISTLISSGLVLSGYLYRVPIFTALWTYFAVALHAAIGTTLLAAGILAARPDQGLLRIVTSGSAGGLMARRLLPAVLFIPPALGWLRLEGERMGYYDTAFGLALFTGSTVVLFTAILLWNAQSLGRLDEARRAQEAHLKLLVEHSPAGIAMFDRQMRYLVVSPRWLTDYGLEGRELIGRSHYEIFPDLPEEWKAVHRRCLQGDVAHKAEDPFPRASGRIDWVRWEVRPWKTPEGGIGGILIFSELVTERRQAEERFHATFEQAAVGIAHVGPDGHWLRVNEKLCSILGYTRAELQKSTLHELTHPDDLPAAREHIRRMIEGSIDTYSLEKRLLRKDGSTAWVTLTRSLVRHPSGAPDYFITVIEDVSRRKEAEERLRQSQRMEVVGRLAGGVAHDFNNLLTPILGYSDLCLGSLAADHPMREAIQEIRRSAERAGALTRQLLAFSRKQVMQPKVLDLNGLIDEAARLLRRLIGEDVLLELHLSPAAPRVKVDPGQMEQVLMNLAINARDAMPRGGRLTIETSAAQLDEGHVGRHEEVVPGRYALISVSDTGTGMTPEVRSKLFEPFFTTKAQGKGTGLGLATVHGIVRQSQGYIWVYSELGRGTTFRVYLPEAPEETPGPSPVGTIPGASEARGEETILLVEDDDAVRTFAVRVLIAKGYRVLEARTGEQALVLSKSHPGSVDLLLTDVVMPGMSGRETARQLQATRPRIRVLYMSGYTENAIVHHGVLDEGTEFLEKPFTPDSLAQKVRSVLDHGRA